MRVLHVVATDRRRGAEMFADDLRRALTRLGVEQSALTLDVPLDVDVKVGDDWEQMKVLPRG